MATLLRRASCVTGICLTGIVTLGGAQAVVPAQPQARFKVTVTADETVVAKTYDFLELISKRNAVRARLATNSMAPALELIRLVARRTTLPTLPTLRRSQDVVVLRVNQDTGIATIEFCRARCSDVNPRLDRFEKPLAEFMTLLDETIAGLERYRRPVPTTALLGQVRRLSS
ncbi:MAG: hypothetical protein HQ485_06045 [Acidobacteria bacterium]|jgi:hypothetical protein|nr:hypothetical protein [Acidobacteriota bacterium]